MSIRVVMLGLIALAAVALGVIYLQLRGGQPRQAPVAQALPPPPVQTASYLVAARTLPPGTLARPEDFTLRTVPLTKLPAGVIVDSPNARVELRGALVRRLIEIGAAVHPTDVTRPGDRGFLAAVLTSGTRAVSISVNQVSGVAGLIWPGDRVDLILTQDITPPGGQKIIASETIMTDVRIIAVDQTIAQGTPATGAAGKPAATVTVEATNDQAEKIAAAERLGKLSLAVRSIADDNQPINIVPGGVTGSDVSGAYARAMGSGGSGTTMELIEGGKRTTLRFK